MSKLFSFVNGESRVYRHDPVYCIQSFEGSPRRILAAYCGSEAFLDLTNILKPPFQLLYILVTPIASEQAGRYRSPEISREELKSFFRRYDAYLHNSGSFHLWIEAPKSRARLLWDHHDLIFAYGPLNRFSEVLRQRWYREDQLEIPSPHVHIFRPDLAADAESLMTAFDWTFSPLQEGDVY